MSGHRDARPPAPCSSMACHSVRKQGRRTAPAARGTPAALGAGPRHQNTRTKRQSSKLPKQDRDQAEDIERDHRDMDREYGQGNGGQQVTDAGASHSDQVCRTGECGPYTQGS
jgi:hypothetical protein